MTTMKSYALLAVPFGVVTEIGPYLAPAGTVAWISVSESTVKTAGAPLNATEVAPVKFQPRISTVVPMCPLTGVNESTCGAEVTVNADLLVPVPFSVVTETGPLVAPAGTVAWISEFESTVKTAGVPLNATE